MYLTTPRVDNIIIIIVLLLSICIYVGNNIINLHQCTLGNYVESVDRRSTGDFVKYFVNYSYIIFHCFQ